MAAAYEQGVPAAKLAVQFGVSRKTVHKHLKRLEVRSHQSQRRLTGQDLANASHRYRRGESLASLAVELGVHWRTLRKRLVEAGVAIRSPR